MWGYEVPYGCPRGAECWVHSKFSSPSVPLVPCSLYYCQCIHSHLNSHTYSDRNCNPPATHPRCKKIQPFISTLFPRIASNQNRTSHRHHVNFLKALEKIRMCKWTFRVVFERGFDLIDSLPEGYFLSTEPSSGRVGRPERRRTSETLQQRSGQTSTDPTDRIGPPHMGVEALRP